MTHIDTDYEDELIKARMMEGFAPLPLLQVTKSPKDLGYSRLSSIEAAEQNESPILAPPKQNIMIRLIQTNAETERLASQKAKQFEIDAAEAQEEIDRLNLEKEEAFLKELEANKNKDTWETVSTIAEYITCMSAVALGMSIGILTLPGFLLGAAGVIGGTVRLGHDTNLLLPVLQPILGWYTKSHKLQVEIKQNIDTYALYLQMGLGLAGGFAAWHTGAMAAMQSANLLDWVNQGSSILGSTSTVMKVGGDVGQAYYNKHFLDASADAKVLDLQLSSEGYDLKHMTKDMQEVLEASENQVNQIRKAIQRQEIQID